MSTQHDEQITVSIRTTRIGWQHIIQLLRQDSDPAWSLFDNGFIALIENALASAAAPPQQPSPQQNDADRESPEMYGYYLGDDGQYHDEMYFAENYGSYSNYQQLSDGASDLGFPDAESYQTWLDDLDD